jgi:hypothetical protein
VEFLIYCDGWIGLDGQMDLFPISELLDGSATEEAWVIIEAYDEGSGWKFGLFCDRYLVIGAAESSPSVVLLDLASPPRVCWLTQGGMEEFPDLEALIATAAEYNLATLADLQADPWLGTSAEAGCYRLEASVTVGGPSLTADPDIRSRRRGRPGIIVR